MMHDFEIYIHISSTDSSTGTQAVIDLLPWKEERYMQHVNLMTIETASNKEEYFRFFGIMGTDELTLYRLAKYDRRQTGLWLTVDEYLKLIDVRLKGSGANQHADWLTYFKRIFLQYMKLFSELKERGVENFHIQLPDFVFTFSTHN